jgi:hypothetical protein
MSHSTQPQTGEAGAPATSHVQSDDIQVGFIAILTVWFGAFLLVSLIGLEAFFYNSADAEAKSKTLAQGSEHTELGQARAHWNTMLSANGKVDNIVAPGKEDAAGKMTYPKIDVVPIGKAMDDVVKQYGLGTVPATRGTEGGKIER